MRRILFYGDSNTYGFDPRDGGRYPETIRWPDRLAASFAARLTDLQSPSAVSGAEYCAEYEENGAEGMMILADGMNGRRVPDLTSPAASVYVDAMLRRAVPLDIFAVMLGTNDLWWPMEPDAEIPASSMKLLLEHVRSLCVRERENDAPGSSCRILLIAPPHLLENDTVRRESRRLTELYRKLAEENGYEFADAETWGIDLAFDRVHFSEKGHRQFAAEMEKVLMSVL